MTWNFQFKTPYGPYFLGNTQQTWTAKRNDEVFATGKTPINNIGPRFNNFVEVKDYAVARAVDRRRRRTASRSSPASATTRSSPTSARSSTSSRSARRGRPGTRAGARTSCPATTSTRSPCRSRSRRSTTKSHTIGVWAATNRKNVTVHGHLYKGWTQVSRLGEPARSTRSSSRPGKKDLWNRTTPQHDSQFKQYYETPILAAVLNKLYKLGVPETKRDDLVAVLGTGIPKVTFTGEDLRGRAPDQPRGPRHGEARTGWASSAATTQGFPNGRRLDDDIVDIEEQAVAGFLKGKKVPLGDGVNANDMPFMAHFPYVPTPHEGYANSKATN